MLLVMYRTRLQWLCLWLLLTTGSGAFAQSMDPDRYALGQGESLPSWVVPVLRLVSATHVEPTTGIVLSDTGLVLVPEGFASFGEEIIVLDGGTDIIRNGRPARIEEKFVADGVQVISVQGLNRRGVSVSAGPLADGDQVRLAAFPPAELIAEGKPPLNLTASVVVLRENGTPAISDDTPLPNVTGPLIDSCGDLAGFSVADDVQSMEASAATRYAWRASILQFFERLQITPRESACAAAEQQIPPQPAVEEPPPEPAIEEEAVDTKEQEEAVEEEPPVEPEEDFTLEFDVLPPIEKDPEPTPEIEEEPGPGGWLWMIMAVILFGLGFTLHRYRQMQRKNEPEGAGSLTPGAPAPMEEEAEEAETDPVPDSLDSQLHIEGVLSDGTVFEDSCAVSKSAINIVIGRGDADLRIDSVAVSRHHANLNGTATELTLSDLGSSNGSSINGVPCLEGEIMFIEPGDSIVLGDARFSIEIKPRSPAGSSSG